MHYFADICVSHVCEGESTRKDNLNKGSFGEGKPSRNQVQEKLPRIYESDLVKSPTNGNKEEL